MLKNYLKIALRNIYRNKFFSVINILGLAMGLACSLLILLWVQNELGIDSFHKNRSQLYVVYNTQYFDHKVTSDYSTAGILAAEIKKEIPEVEYSASFAGVSPGTFKAGNKVLKLDGTSADADFFKMFSYPLIQGSVQSALNTPSAMAISRKMAVEFFGSTLAAMGKTLRYQNSKDFIVSAVFEDLPSNVSKKFDFVTNWFAFTDDNPWSKAWGSTGPLSYVQLRADANPAAVGSKLQHFLDKFNGSSRKNFREELSLQRFGESYLHGQFKEGKIDGGRIEYVKLFSVIAVLILIIACINFMNLTTARSVKRAREIGVRKVVGAVRKILIFQFMGESLLITAIAVIVSLAILIALLPIFNSVTQKQIELPFTHLSFWLRLLAITLVTGLIAGIYPALVLSSFNPILVLKGGNRSGHSANWFLKGLVVFQFALSAALIISTIIISRQLSYMQSINLGYDRENLVYIPLEGDLVTRYEVFKQEALKTTGIQAITRISLTPTNIYRGLDRIDWDGKDPNTTVRFIQADIGYDFIKTMKLKMADGRDYSMSFPTDTTGYIVNETALKKIGYPDPIGRRFVFRNNVGKIIGVMKDFHFNSLHEEIKPLVMRFGEHIDYGSALVRTQPGKTREALANLEALYKQLNPNFQFTYKFSDEEYNRLYKSEQIVSKLSNSFAFLAIFISCLGLMGLAMFTAGQRLKEIGVRKILGASVTNIMIMLSKDFLILVLTSIIIASPVAWYFMHKWLQDYAYKINIQWWVFALAAVIVVLIAIITISFQSIKAATANPVKSLRSE